MMKNLLMLSLFLCSFQVLAQAPSQKAPGDLYKWMDKNGVAHFTSTPPPPDALPYQPQFQNDQWSQTTQRNATPQSNKGSGQQSRPEKPYWEPAPPLVSKEAEAKCKSFFASLNVDKKEIPGICGNPDYAKPTVKSEFDSCRSQINGITKNPYAQMLCFEIVREDRGSLSQETLNCLSDSIHSTETLFYFFEGMTRFQEKNKIEYTVKDCLQGHYSYRVNGQANIINQFHYHTSHLRKSRKGDMLGGLSGMWWDKHQQKYHLISDNQRFPFMLEVDWNPLDPQSVPVVGTETSIQNPDDKTYKNNERFDFEEIIKLPNGNFIVSSEVDDQKSDEDDGGGGFGKFLTFFKKKNSNKIAAPLIEISPKGDLIRELPVADAILPKNITSTKQYDCTPYEPPPAPKKESRENQNGFDGNGDFRFDTARVPGAAESVTVAKPRAEKKFCSYTETRRGEGFEPNKGIEAISYLESTNEIFYGTESPLIQDRNSGDRQFIRIYRQTMDRESQTQRYVKYPIKEDYNNGLPAMVALNENEMLILERGFDDYKRQTHIRIYKIDWNKIDADGYLIKQKLVTMNDLQGQMPAGFQRFDNLEGMALGPETATHITVVLVSDNNFSKSQVTQFITLEIPKELLK